MKIEFAVLHREKALAAGFKGEDFGFWIDMVSQWLFSCGAKEVGYGGGDADAINVQGYFENEPEALMLGDVVLREGMKAQSPLLLEDFNPHTFRVVLQAWDFAFQKRVESLVKIEKATKDFIGSLSTELRGFPKFNPNYPEEITVNLKFAVPKGEMRHGG